MKPQLLTVREVGRVLRCHRPKVYELIKAGKIEGFKLGSDYRIRIASVEKLLGAEIPAGFFERPVTLVNFARTVEAMQE